MSFFAFKRVAEGYAKYRPQFHPLIMKKIRAVTDLKDKFNYALDVGSGTGLSTIALTEIATHITGKEEETSVKSWIYETLRPLLPQNHATFIFRGYIWYVQRGGVPVEQAQSG